METEPITFYAGGFNCFSNMAAFAVEIDGVLFMTSEHAYQSARFSDESIKEKIKNTRSALDAKLIAGENKELELPNWYEINLSVMESIVRSKLQQHPYIQKKLIESGEREIFEASDDSFWGWGKDKNGRNELGKIWMKLRKDII